MASRARNVLGRVALVLLLTVGATVHAASPAAAATCTSAFSSGFAAGLGQRYPGIRVTAAVYDTQSGGWHHLHQGMQITTASVIKAQVLGAVLLKAQDAGRGLTSWERSQIARPGLGRCGRGSRRIREVHHIRRRPLPSGHRRRRR